MTVRPYIWEDLTKRQEQRENNTLQERAIYDLQSEINSYLTDHGLNGFFQIVNHQVYLYKKKNGMLNENSYPYGDA